MNLLVSNYLILLGLRSFSAVSPTRSWILFHESMALTMTENFPKLFILKDFYEDGLLQRKLYYSGEYYTRTETSFKR